MKKVQKSVFDDNLIPVIAGTQSESLARYSEDAFSLATKAGDWLPRLQLMTSNSEKCKAGDFPINHYAVIDGSNYADAGKEVDVLVITWRPKAMDISGDDIISVYDPKLPAFERIQLLSEDSDSGCMFGIEFLMYIPLSKKFVTFFMGSKSSRREAVNVKAFMRKAATLKSMLIEGKKYKWQSPVVSPCSTPFEVPALDAIMVEVDKFNNPEVVVPETATAAESEATTRER